MAGQAAAGVVSGFAVDASRGKQGPDDPRGLVGERDASSLCGLRAISPVSHAGRGRRALLA